ncbi:uncharacterized protein LOC135201372 [Macrobrachium nipponense]|uniref:uncharacterized protein LOC135201372 n=1 Tax=Macrobrachium nipponense TaxID=159736 RepID=UPI0030C7BAD1
MAENISRALTVPAIRRGTKRFNEQVNHGFWIDRNQARYIDQGLFIDSSSWILKSDHSQPNDSSHMTNKVNYWRLPGVYLNFPSHPNQSLNQYHAERDNAPRTTHERTNGTSPGDMTTSKTNTIPQQKCVTQGENKKTEIGDLIQPDITTAPQKQTRKKQGEQPTHLSQEHCSKSGTKTISRPKEASLHGSNEESLERNISFHLWPDKSNANSETKLNETYIGNLNYFKIPALPLPSKIHNNLQDPNTSGALQDDSNKPVAPKSPEYKEKPPVTFPANKQDNVLPVVEQLLPGPWPNKFNSNLPGSELESAVTAPIDTVQQGEFNTQKPVNLLNLQSAIYKDGTLCDDTLMTSTTDTSKLQTNNITTNPASGSESWFKLISQDSCVSNTGKDQAQAAANMKKLKELRQGFRGTYSKINFFKSNDPDAKTTPTGIYSADLSNNLESAAENKLSEHNQRHNENANEMSTIHVDLEIETKIKTLLQNSLQTKVLRKKQKLLNTVPKSKTGATKEDGIVASTSNASMQYETIVPDSSQAPTYSKSPGNVRPGKDDARQKCASNPLNIIRMEVPSDKKEIFFSLCKNNPGLITYLSQQAFSKNLKGRNKKLPSILRPIRPKKTGCHVVQSPYTMGGRASSASNSNVSFDESVSNSITNQITVSNAEVQKMAHSQENETVPRVTAIQQKANSTPDYESEKSLFGQNAAVSADYQQPAKATEYQILVSNSCDHILLKPTDNHQVINTAEYPPTTNTVDLLATRDTSTTFQPIINSADQQPRYTFEHQPPGLTVPVMDDPRLNSKNEEAKANAIGGHGDKLQQLKHFEQLLKMEYDRYIENKLKLLKADTGKVETSAQGGRKSTEKKDDDDVLVIDYFDVDSFIQMETTG